MKNLLFLFVLLSLLYCTDTSNKTKTAPSKNINYNKAGDYRDSGNYDSAFIYYSFAKNDFLKINDTLGITKSLINMAIIQTDNGDFFGGIETSLEAEKFLKKNDSITNQLKSSNYNNLALANDELENFDKKFSYIDGLQFIPEHYERDFSSDVPDEIEEFGRNLSKKRDDFKFYKAVF